MRTSTPSSIASLAFVFITFYTSIALAQRIDIIPPFSYATPGSFTYIVPAPILGMEEFIDEIILDVTIVGGGGGGGRGDGAGGGGGGRVRTQSFTSVVVGGTFTVIVGTGGLGGSAPGNVSINGQNGTLSSFGGVQSAPGAGGLGGINGNGGNSGNGNAGGVGRSFTFLGVTTRFSGGGGGGSLSIGQEGTIPTSFTGNGGNGGIGTLGYGGGGGGNGNTTRGLGRDGGTNGNTGTATNATNGGGGGGGGDRGGNGGNGLVIITATFSILPVEYAHLDANFDQKSRSTEIKWGTLREWENSHFEVERAIDDVNDFEQLGKVSGIGYSDELTEYIFTDDSLPLAGGMAYYRIKQVDFSGAFDISKVLGVRIPPISNRKGVWRAFPNPTSGDTFHLHLLKPEEYQDEMITVRLFNSKVSNKFFQSTDLKELSETISNKLKQSPNGFYILEIRWGYKIKHIKIMKR